MNVCINTTSGCDQPFPAMRFGAGTDNHIRLHTILCIRISGLSYAYNLSVFDANICFYNTPVINNRYICNDQIKHTLVPGSRTRL
ncbi:hypothetical protein D3C86_1859160 [compost metagenome]